MPFSVLSTFSLFSGIGRMKRSVSTASGAAQPVAFCESWEPARSVLHAHFPDVPVDDDVTSLGDLRSSDLVTGGFPCTDLSQAGRTRGLGVCSQASCSTYSS